MAGIYSVCFTQFRSAATGGTGLYTVPAGHVAVVRDIVLYCEFDATPGQIGLFVFDLGGSPCMLYREMEPTPGLTYHWDGRQVLVAGETLNLYSEASTAVLRVSGYLLEG